ncbi:hypothetical protein BDZ89DRAFT_1163726 [Hymenopellis radicata]|nr:hypothetical protein BDZ89DRAFT_1163726 [Hymenopellis radicata]
MPPKKAATAAKAKTTAPKKPAPAKKAPTPKRQLQRKRPRRRPQRRRLAKNAPGRSRLAARMVEDAPVPQAKASKEATPDKDTVDLFGKFDIYHKDLPCLDSGYDKGSPDFEKLLELMKKFQAEPDFTARAAIPKSYGSDGAFEIKAFEDPMSGEQYEISLEGIQLIGKDEPTIKGRLSVDGGCGVSSSSGTLSLHRCWTKPTSRGGFDEIFECTININVSYSGLYRRKGHGSGLRLNMKCWAIRAQKLFGEEIGLTLN